MNHRRIGIGVLALLLGCGGGGGGGGSGGLAPTVTTINPNQGPETGGTAVTIGGGSFMAGAAVLFGGSNARSITFVSDSQLDVVTPSGPVGPVSVRVVNPGGKSATIAGGFTYQQVVPQITSVFPNQGPSNGGMRVTIYGADFLTGAWVEFGGAPASGVLRVAPGELSVVIPGGPVGTVDVMVRNPSGGSDTLVAGFTFKPNIMLEALNLAGVTSAEVGWDANEYSIFPSTITGDDFRLGFYDAVHDEPLTAPAYFQGLVDDTDGDVTGPNPVSDLIHRYSEMLDRGVTPGDPVHTPDPGEPLAQAVADLITARGGTPDLPALQADAADVPVPLQQKVAEIVLAIRDGAAARDAAFASLPAGTDLAFWYDYTPAFIAFREDTTIFDPRNADNKAFLNGSVSYLSLYQGGYDLVRTIENVDLQYDPAYTGFSFNQQTPIGRIIVEDNGIHTYDPNDPGYSGEIALVVDTGGNDTYWISAGGNSSENEPVSVAIDLQGDDVYAYEIVPHVDDLPPRLDSDVHGRADPASALVTGLGYGPVSISDAPRQGAGRMGIGILFDLGVGIDDYQSLRMSQGFGAMGIGVLYDQGGDDAYRGECAVQGCGIFGMGILLDGGGFDGYESYSASQGFGYVRGAGVLYDRDGDDDYWVEEGADPIYYNPQDPGGSNTSLSQGAGDGLRVDGWAVWWSGGIGLLRDVTGADTYWASVFAQGTGYWYGTGVLADSGGDDFYDAKWYVQAGAAHFAMALLLEGGGNDTYNSFITPMNVTLGGGHDYSLAMLVEESGNDWYRGAGLSLGAGNVNGIGIFVDNLGSDTYECLAGNSAGSATADGGSAARQSRRTIGFFLDGDLDSDTYNHPNGSVGNDGAWMQSQTGSGIEWGVGVDRPTGETTLHFR